MSKKLMSLVLAVAMVMSVFCVAFSTSAAADEAEVEKVTYYFYAPPVGLSDIRAYWWSAGDAPKDWPGVEMTAVPALGANVYSVDVSTEAPFIIFNGQMPSADSTETTLVQTVNVNLNKEENDKKPGTGLDNVANMCFVVTGQEGTQFTGTWCSFDPKADNYYRSVGLAAGYPEDDSEQAYIPGVDEVFVHGEDLTTPATCTYYFYAPAGYGTDLHAYWWSAPDAPSDWPGVDLTAAPEIGDNVYKVTMSTQAPFVIFNGAGGSPQTANINLAKDDNDAKPGTGLNNVSNKIFVITDDAETQNTGVWCSLDPNDDDYYRTVAGIEKESVTMPVVPPYHGYFLGGVEPEEETDDEPVIEGISFYFRADGEKFSGDPKKTCFYIWDATDGKFATKAGWGDTNTWGSKKTQGTEVEVEGETLLQSYNVDIDSTHDVFCIIYDSGTGEQTFDCVLTSAANGKVLEITGAMLENPVDSTKEAIEAAFIDADGCGPHKVITSSCHVVGTAATPHDDYVEQMAQKVAQYVNDEGNTTDWTYAAAQDVMGQLQIDPQDVWDAYMESYGEDYDADQIAAAKKVILGEEDVDTDTTDTADQSDTDTSKETDDTASDSDTDTTGKETDDTATDSEDTDSAKETDDTATDSEDTDSAKETDDTATDTSDTDTSKETEDTADTATDTEDTETDTPTDTEDTDEPTDTEDTDEPTDTEDTDKPTDTEDTDKPTDTDDTDTEPKTKKALCGDVNEDGVVDSADALLILRDGVGLDMSAEKYNGALADVNGDTVIDSADALEVLRYSVGLPANENVGAEVEIPA